MVTLVDLALEENPLTCPPANLCGRGRVHIFKYLEIQVHIHHLCHLPPELLLRMFYSPLRILYVALPFLPSAH
jgi:hypothetical protein